MLYVQSLMYNTVFLDTAIGLRCIVTKILWLLVNGGRWQPALLTTEWAKKRTPTVSGHVHVGPNCSIGHHVMKDKHDLIF